ncbi:LMBR1-like membrane protein-domain-containing protein [Pilobolus umbonatus]|nr:LMBR1-like membrane protein-domain-containing protein [Pilobolus umbonatus]
MEPPVEHSDWLPLVLIAVAALFLIIFIVSRYGDFKQHYWYVSVVCIVGWYLPLWIVLLLPLDLASTMYDQNQERLPYAYVSQKFLFVAWRVMYWTSFCLTWMAIPMLQAYVNTGDFTMSKRIRSAFHVNLRFYSMYVVVGIIGLFYLVNRNGYTTREKIQSYVMAAANSWGLFLVIVFMGYGLVSLPRTLWYSGNSTHRLHQIYANAVRLNEECFDSELEYNDLAKKMNAISKKMMQVQPDIQYCIKTMNRRFPFVLNESFSRPDNNLPRELTEEYLVRLSKDMIIAMRMRDRKKALWDNSLTEAFYLQDTIRNKELANRMFQSSLRPTHKDTGWTRFKYSIEWWWRIRIKPLTNKVLAMIFAVISTCIIWSELVFNVKKPVISIVSRMLMACGMNYAAVEIVSFFTLLYMCMCVYSSLFKVRFFDLYLLIPNHHTDENSLLWFTSYMCKMVPPLCYNFINLASDLSSTSDSVFSTFMGKADLTPFLGQFVDWFPILILIPSLSLLFQFQGNYLGLCGIRSLNENDTDNANMNSSDIDIIEGEKLIKKEREKREHEINPSSRTTNHSSRNSKNYTNKYGRTNPPSSIRSERDRQVDDILSRRYNHHSTPSTSSVPPEEADHDDQVTLKDNLIQFGDTIKSKFSDLLNKPKSSQAPKSNTLANDTLPRFNDRGSRAESRNEGRVFGRPLSYARDDTSDNQHNLLDSETTNLLNSRSTSPNFLIPPSNNTVQYNTHSPF